MLQNMKYGAFDTFLRTASIVCIIIFGILAAVEGFSRLTSPDAVVKNLYQDIGSIAGIPQETEGYEWRAIVVHHSGVEEDTLHDLKKRYSEMGFDSVPFHFIIIPDGTVVPTPAWKSQKPVQQTMDEYFNKISIGICVIGNFSLGQSQPTQYQMISLKELIKYLMSEMGIKKINVLPDRDIDDTQSPGKNFPWKKLLYALK
jgi:N-acetyl-anhydromuramyl-L-alanine amidase AmpD